ncbi:hypothetical protein BGW39_007187 [Mortierella sp. 14UC]|nr:hypothetical protein BGW39_007187 [Mortierella sp. 14UC]
MTKALVSNSNNRRRWRRMLLTLFVLVAVSSTNSVSAVGGPEGYTRLENPTGAAYDPLQPLTDQLILPVVAGAPPLPSTATIDPNSHTKEQQAYKERLEIERFERQGAFYVELTPLELQLAAASAGSGGNGPAGSVRYSKEPLPWEGLGQGENEVTGGENGTDSEDESSLGWSYSPWGGEFRYEVLADREDEDEGDEFFEDDGEDSFYYDENEEEDKEKESRVEDQDWSRLELTTLPKAPSQSSEDIENKKAEATPSRPWKEMTQALKMEASSESGESFTNQDPNVDDNVKEAVVDSQIWYAEGAAQTPSASNTQLYVEVPLGRDDGKAKEEEDTIVAPAGLTGGRSFAAEPIGSATLDSSMEAEVEMVRPKLDQIDLLGHEAEMDWLQEQDDIQRAWRLRHNHRESQRYEDDEDEEEDGADVDEDREVQEAPFSSGRPLSDAEWDKKHGQ